MIERALTLDRDDLEDANQAAAALDAGIPALVTRNPGDHGSVPNLQILAPEVAAAALGMP